MEYHQLTAHEILEHIKHGETTPEDVYADILKYIDTQDKKIHSFVRVNKGIPAIDADAKTPIPIAIKDNLCIQGREVTCASKILKGFIPPYDATVIRKIKSEGMPIIGQTNMDEFAFGSSTENSCYGPTHNPWDLNCVPGGSSGGSAAVVASDQAVWALGSDTGGSIRQPASFCGVVGLKPTYGRVSRYGLIAFASSLDQIGPLTKDVHDSALLLSIIAGHDPMDSTSVDPEKDEDLFRSLESGCRNSITDVGFIDSLGLGVKGLTLGIPKEYFIDGMDPEVKTSVLKAIDVLKKKGANFIDISLPHTEYAVSTYYIIATAEASSNLARFDGVRHGLRCMPEKPRKSSIIDMFEETRDIGFGDECKRRIMLGTYSLSSGYYDAYYLKGQRFRSLIKKDFDQAFKECDAIITPTSPTTAFKIGERADDPLSMYLSDIYTISANLSGIPAISLPCGFSKKGLPIGLQIMSNAFNENMLFQVAHTYEQNTEWHKHKPNKI